MIDSRNKYSLPSILPFANPASKVLITMRDHPILFIDIVFDPSMSNFKDETSILLNKKGLNENMKYHIFHYSCDLLYRKRNVLYGIYYLIALTRGKLRGGK